MDLTELFRFEADLLQIGAGEPVFKVGDPGDRMYVLMAGEADIVVGNVVVERAAPGALLGELALVDATPRTATVMAVTDCSLLPIDVKRFRFLVQETPNFALHVMKVIAERLRRMDRRLLEVQGTSV
ncbi:MAG: cyclic nucleotide-binding domain-containing protein [Burkholderiales bacterium]